MTMPMHGAAVLAATTISAAVLAAVVAVPTASEPLTRAPTAAGPLPATGAPVPGTTTPAAVPTPTSFSTPLAAADPLTASAASATSTSGTSGTAGTSPSPAAGTATPSASALSAARASTVFASMTRAQKIGQLFMIGNDATVVAPSTLSAITSYHVGNVMLRGRSSAGVAATARVSAAIAARVSNASTASVRLFLATDQEGGSVRVLRGTGFDAIPSALTQGTWGAATLRLSAARWGAQLHRAGINLDLAPVLDTVPSAAAAATNPPIGSFRREFGFSPATVGTHGVAFVHGLASAGVDSAIKHFPGLGRVTGNPDTTAHVTDRVTTRHDGYFTPFQSAINGGSAFLMMSTAFYSRIDAAHPAAFSPTVITGIVRGDLGFQGVVISDDLGNAAQVAAWAPGSRAVQFLAAGGDMVLTVNSALLPAMVRAVTAKVQADPVFAQQVDASVMRILTAKAERGLL